MSYPDRFRFRFDAVVVGSDGQVGTLRHVLLELGTKRVIGLVIRTGMLFGRELRVSLSTIVSATEDGIHLSLTAREARDLKRKQATLLHAERFVNDSGSSGEVASGKPLLIGVALSDAYRVTALDGSAGHLRQLLVDAASGEIEELVIETGLFNRQCRRLTGSRIRRITDTILEINCTVDAVTSLPPFIGNRELRASILDAWFYDDGLRMTLLRAPLEVTVHEGVAVLEGNASQRTVVSRLEARARSVPGVLEVCSAIVVDEELVSQVISALDNDPRTQSLRPRVQSTQGVVYLEGEAPDRGTHEAAAQISAAVPHVRGVINRLRVCEERDPSTAARLSHPGSRQWVNAPDGRADPVNCVLPNSLEQPP